MLWILILLVIVSFFSIQEIYAQDEGISGEDYKAFKESLERTEKEEQLGVLIPIIIALVGVGIAIMLIKHRRK